MGAEAAVADADAVLGAEPGGDERVVARRRRRRSRPAARRSSGGAEQPDAVDRARDRRAARRPARRRGRAMASQPMRSSSSMAAWSATAPMTLGEPASSRSGGSVHTTSSRSTRSTAPPPARNGSPSAKVRGARRARRRRTARTSCGRSMRRSRRRAGSGRCGASCAASTSTGTPRSWAASMIVVDGGIQPVTLDAPVIASSRGRGPSSSAAATASASKVPVGVALDVAAARDARPRQQVGVVLDDGGDDDVVGLEPQPVGEVVDRLGGVAADDGDVVAVAPSRPAKREAAAARPRRRRWRAGTSSPRRGARSSTTAGTRATRSATAGSGGGRRGGVERQVAALVAVDARHREVVADEADAEPVVDHAPFTTPREGSAARSRLLGARASATRRRRQFGRGRS